MTSETGKEKPVQGGTERPHATLDLKAKEIFAEGAPQPSAAQTALPGSAAEPKVEAGPTPSPDTPPSGQEPRNSGGVGNFFIGMVAGLLGAVLALGGAYLFGALHDGERIDALDRALASAQQRLAGVENATRTVVNEGGSADARLKTLTDQGTALKQDVTELGKRVEAVENRPATPAGPSPESMQASIRPLNAKIAELENRITAIAKAQDELRASTGTAALTMAVQNLRRAVAEGKPFSTEWKTLASLTSEPLEAAPLEARRESGLASLAKLQHDFDVAAKAAIDAARPAGDGSFTGDLLAKARNLVRVRPTGDVAGDAPEAILARAEHRLDSGDIAAAIRETSQLTGAAAQAMTPWLNEAKDKAAADDALAKIEARLMTSLGSDERAKRGG
jgi:hypothetical protein